MTKLSFVKVPGTDKNVNLLIKKREKKTPILKSNDRRLIFLFTLVDFSYYYETLQTQTCGTFQAVIIRRKQVCVKPQSSEARIRAATLCLMIAEA